VQFPSRFAIPIVASIAMFALLPASLCFAQTTFTFVSFDPPGSANTQVWAINDAGTVVGDYADSSGVYSGFKRVKSGAFSKPIERAGENVYTDGINNKGIVSGYYSVGPGQGYPPPNPVTTFTLQNQIYTTFTIGTDTQINALNDDGDFTGIYEENSSIYPAFLHVASTNSTVTFSVPGANFTFGYGINNQDEVVGAYKVDVSDPDFSSFIRQADGRIQKFDVAGHSASVAANLNNCGTIVGAFLDASGLYHGYYGHLNHFTKIDYPGSTMTIATGINKHGVIVGHYSNADGVFHGFVATPATPSCSP